jgi:hypothetical protein
MERARTPIGLSSVVALALLAQLAGVGSATAQSCKGTVTAHVIALDQPITLNRLGAMQPQGMMYALAHDVYPNSVGPADEKLSNSCAYVGCSAGRVHLRSDKRPRPLVLRMNVGNCLSINFQNLLDPVRRHQEQVKTRDASIHVIGLQLVETIQDDGSNVGSNGAWGNGVVPTGGRITYTLYAEREGQHVMYSTGAMTGGQGDGGQLNAGLFGAVNVEPVGSRWYRSQVTAEDLHIATIGTTPGGQPRIDYGMTYPSWHPRSGLPIFAMTDASNRIMHSDLTAIIAGPFEETYPKNPVYPQRNQSFREFTILYHDEVGAVQAFPKFFGDAVFAHTLHSVRDAFAINYDTGSIGAEIIANRLGVGPMLDCTGCKYEEFFLSAWTVGDPAMIVDVPANASNPDAGIRAKEAYFPDDPSNVYHSYLRDHLKFRIMHAGSKEHHIHHQHTHQWVFSPDSDESSYLDSQAIGPGASYTLEMAYHGSGNRNQAVGDSIFHCHFYPHFAQGMWAMWRVHDVFEDGSRRLPDGEIEEGTPIPAVVPVPGIAMAPMPGAAVNIVPDPRYPKLGGQVQVNGKFVQDMTPADIVGVGNPGYPFWVPGIAGHRPPHPPLDTIDDGGLPRHVVTAGKTTHVETRLDFTKIVDEMAAIELSELGEPVEVLAMQFHGDADLDGDGSTRTIPSYAIDLSGGVKSANFVVNGLGSVAGAPFADPCVDDDGSPIGGPINEQGNADPARTYKAANIQLDVVFNKAGWHFPQQRILTLWDDVAPTYAGTRPPEPLFIRAESGECIEYHHTNLVPNIYELDDFQVRTPTDILGQHIHLVKFDVLASDGSANGWNYEDGTFSPDEVIERIEAIRHHNGCVDNDPRNGTFECPEPRAHPKFTNVLGAQTTVQRWYADPVLNLQGQDRTLRTVFTHDHYGPSTHQQAGLYAGLVIEPEGSTWRDPETGAIFGGGTREDGGPTSWRADILTPDEKGSYREFLLEFADFQLAYKKDSHPEIPFGKGPTTFLPWHGVARQPGEGYDRPAKAINPPGKKEDGLPYLLKRPDKCPVLQDEGDATDFGSFGGTLPSVPLPCPEAISADDPGTMVVNYRNEPLALRSYDPFTGKQAVGNAGDLALSFSSRVSRAMTELNSQPAFYPPLTDNIQPRDPYTPLLQGYEHDQVQVRILVGAHEEGHNFSINGMKWLFEPSWSDSGYRGSQMMGISEHFEFEIPQLVKNPLLSTVDYLWLPGSATDDLWNGLWGIFRVFRGSSADLLTLPNNPTGGKPLAGGEAGNFDGVCPKAAPVRSFEVIASTAQQLLGGPLVYNPRLGPNGHGPLDDPTALMYVRASDVDANGRLLPGVPVEPLILRARAGECIEVSLYNDINRDSWSAQYSGLGFNTLPMLIDRFNNNQIQESDKIGLHPQLLHYDVSRSDGNNVGLNQIQTANPGHTVTYQWYAGDLYVNDQGLVEVTPIEFGATNLIPADRMKQPSKGAIGALIIEPKDATWVEDADLANCGVTDADPRCSRAGATVYYTDPGGAEERKFREFVLLFQDDLNLRCKDCGEDPLNPDAVPNLADSDDPEDSGQKGFNYRTEPMWFRFGYAPDAPLTETREKLLADILTNAKVGGDPETPVFVAQAGEEVRFRVLEPGGHARNHVFQLHGHVWQQAPYEQDSTVIGENKNAFGQWLTMFEGSRMGHGPTNHFDAVLQNGAGGYFGVDGDYLYRDQSSFLFDGGLWGLFRVLP